MNFQKRIKELRGSMTMEEFGKRIDTKVPTLSSWENAGIIPSVTKLIDISNRLNVTLDYLVGLTDTNPVDPTKALNTQRDLLTNMIQPSSTKQVPTAILGYEYSDNEVYVNTTTSPTHTLIARESRMSYITAYLNPLLQMQIAAGQNIIITDPKLDLSNQLLKQLLGNDYDVYHVNGIGNTPETVDVNLCRYLYDKPREKIENVFERFLNWDGEIWSVLFLEYLVIQYKHMRRVVPIDNMSFETFRNYVNNHTITKEYIDEAVFEISDETYEMVKQGVANVLYQLANSPYVNQADKSDNKLFDEMINSTRSWIGIDTLDTSRMNEIYKQFVIDTMYEQRLTTSTPTSWVLNTAGDPYEYMDKMSISLMRKQQFILVMETNKYEQPSKTLLRQARTIVDMTPGYDISDMLDGEPTREAVVITPDMTYDLNISVPKIINATSQIEPSTSVLLDVPDNDDDSITLTKHEAKLLKKLLSKLNI